MAHNIHVMSYYGSLSLKDVTKGQGGISRYNRYNEVDQMGDGRPWGKILRDGDKEDT